MFILQKLAEVKNKLLDQEQQQYLLVQIIVNTKNNKNFLVKSKKILDFWMIFSGQVFCIATRFEKSQVRILGRTQYRQVTKKTCSV